MNTCIARKRNRLILLSFFFEISVILLPCNITSTFPVKHTYTYNYSHFYRNINSNSFTNFYRNTHSNAQSNTHA